jgi:uncharacterized protein
MFRMSVAITGALVIWLSSAMVSPAQTPSFNCSGNLAPDESTICSSTKLSQLDNELNVLYAAVYAGSDSLHKNQLQADEEIWLQRRSACKTSSSCIANLYQTRITALAKLIKPKPSETGRPALGPGDVGYAPECVFTPGLGGPCSCNIHGKNCQGRCISGSCCAGPGSC